jgi:nucleotide-binding universal stress UspA family protein
MSTDTAEHVVAGVDATEQALAAVTVAARQADARGASLRLVHAFLWPGHSPITEAGDALARQRVQDMLDAAARRAHEEVPGLHVRTAVVDGPAVEVLVEESYYACLVVIGHRGLSTLPGLLSATAGLHLAGATGCPLLVVRGPVDLAGPVVVGLEIGRAASDHLLEVAFEQARVTHRSLVVAHAWRIPGYSFSGETAAYGAEFAEQVDGDALLHEIARVRDRYLDVGVSTEMHYGPAAGSLLNATVGASMLVIGSRSADGLRALLLGSPSRAAIQHAACPVLVVPSDHPSKPRARHALV